MAEKTIALCPCCGQVPHPPSAECSFDGRAAAPGGGVATRVTAPPIAITAKEESVARERTEAIGPSYAENLLRELEATRLQASMLRTACELALKWVENMRIVPGGERDKLRQCLRIALGRFGKEGAPDVSR